MALTYLDLVCFLLLLDMKGGFSGKDKIPFERGAGAILLIFWVDYVCFVIILPTMPSHGLVSSQRNVKSITHAFVVLIRTMSCLYDRLKYR